MQLTLSKGLLSNIWDSANKTVLSTGSKRPAIENGTIYMGYDTTDARAMLFADIGGVRYPFGARVKWTDITDIPDLATQNELDLALTNIGNTYLKMSGGTMTGPLNLSGGDGATAGKIILDQTKAAQITDKSTSTLFGFTTANATNLTVGHSSFGLVFRGSGTRPTFNTKALALYSDIPTDFTTTTAATNAENNAKEYTATAINNLKSVYFSTLTDTKSTSVNSFTLTKADGTTKSSWTANNYYPTAVSWKQENNALKGTITMCNNGVANTSLNVAIPEPLAANEMASGIVTISNQSFKGIKNFADAVQISNKVKLTYNTGSESLDFSFLS